VVKKTNNKTAKSAKILPKERKENSATSAVKRKIAKPQRAQRFYAKNAKTTLRLKNK